MDVKRLVEGMKCLLLLSEASLSGGDVLLGDDPHQEVKKTQPQKFL